MRRNRLPHEISRSKPIIGSPIVPEYTRKHIYYGAWQTETTKSAELYNLPQRSENCADQRDTEDTIYIIRGATSQPTSVILDRSTTPCTDQSQSCSLPSPYTVHSPPLPILSFFIGRVCGALSGTILSYSSSGPLMIRILVLCPSDPWLAMRQHDLDVVTAPQRFMHLIFVSLLSNLKPTTFHPLYPAPQLPAHLSSPPQTYSISLTSLLYPPNPCVPSLSTLISHISIKTLIHDLAPLPTPLHHILQTHLPTSSTIHHPTDHPLPLLFSEPRLPILHHHPNPPTIPRTITNNLYKTY